MEALHDKKLQSLVSRIKSNTMSRYQGFADFAPTTLPRLQVKFEDMMKISPETNFENAYNIQQQMRNADINNQQYRTLYLEGVDRDIQNIKTQLENPDITKETSDNLFTQLEEKMKSKIEQKDPNFTQKTNNIISEIGTMKAQYERDEPNTIMKNYKFLASLSGNPTLGASMLQIPSLNKTYNKLLQLESKARRSRLEGFDLLGDGNADEPPAEPPVELPVGAPPAMAAAGTVAEAIGGEGTGGGVVKEAVGAGAEGKLGEGVAAGAEGKIGEAEKKTKKKGKNPLFKDTKVEPMHIPRVPISGKGDEARLILEDAQARFKTLVNYNKSMTPTQKLAEIDRLRAEKLIVSDGRKGRKKLGE